MLSSACSDVGHRGGIWEGGLDTVVKHGNWNQTVYAKSTFLTVCVNSFEESIFCSIV